MKYVKRLVTAVLTIALCASFFTAAYAKSNKGKNDNGANADTSQELSADVQTLMTLGLLIGSGKDGLTLEYTKSKPTRIQGFIIYLRLINMSEEAEEFVYHPGGDNFDDHAGYSAYVQNMMAYAKTHPEHNWVGSNGRFSPMAHLTAKEYAKIMLAALEYEYNVDFSWQNVKAFAESLELNVPEGAFTFEQLATMTVQTLYTAMKGTDQTLIDYLASINPEFAAKVALLENDSETDTIKPTVTDVVLTAPYVVGSPAVSGRVTVYFSEAIETAALTDLANYTVDLDGSGTAYADTQLSLIAGASAAAAADAKSVTLTIPGSALNGGAAAGTGVTCITVSGVTDLAGNALDTVTRFVRISAVLTVVSAAATDVNKLQVTFNNQLKTVDTTEFRLYRSDGVTLASVGTGYVLDSTGKTITITLGGTLTASAKANDADLTTAKLAIGTAVIKDIFGNAVSGAVAVPVVSASTPAVVAIADKIAPSVASLTAGTAPQTFEMTFTEPVNAVNSATLSAVLKITDLSGTAQTADYTFSGAGGTITSFTKLTATITGGAEENYYIELLGQGVGDLTGNTVRAFVKTALTVVSDTHPVILSAQTQDLDNDGYLDAVRLTFNKNIDDSTVNANNFDIAGYSFEAFYSNTAGDVADNNVIYITFPETGTPDTGVTPAITYTQGSLTDLAGNTLTTTGPLVTTDKAAPVVITALPVGTLTAGGVNSSAELVLSEDITAAAQAAVLVAVQANMTINDLVTAGDITVTLVWTTNRLLTVAITANDNGGVSPDNIVLAAVSAALADASGNITAAAQIVK